MSREMKYSGIVEGFNIPTQWQTMKFGKVCSVVTDFVASGSFADLRANVPYLSEPDYAMLVRTTDLAKTARSEGKVYISKESYDFLSNSNLFGGEIVLPNIGSIGDAYVVPNLYEHMSLAPNAIMFKTNYCDKYYYYYFLSKIGKLQLDEISQSTAIAKFNKTDLKQLRVVLPTLSEQQKIASFLDRKCAEIDEMIALQEKIIDELKAYKQSVIAESVTKGLNPDVPMKDSGIEWIGNIPEHWEIKRLKQTLSKPLQYGANESGIAYNPNLPRYVRITDILDNSLKEDIDKQSLTEEQAVGYILQHNDILFARSGGTVGKSFIYNECYGRCAFAGYLIKASVNSSMQAKFVYYFTQTSCYDEWKKQIFIQSTIQNIGADRYSQLPLTVPSVKEQEVIVNYLDKRCTEIDNLISIKLLKIDSLKEYKKSIIYEYVTGKKEVIE